MTKLSVWSGKADELPPQDVQFLYEGRRYIWHPCDCHEWCGRPKVFDVETEDVSLRLTTLARGMNQGDPVEDMLLKVRLVSLEDISNVIGGPEYAPMMLEAIRKFDDAMAKGGAEFLTAHNVDHDEYMAYSLSLLGIA